MSDATKAEIKKLEDRRFQATIDGDFDTLGKLLADVGLFHWQSDTHPEYIAKCKKGVWTSGNMSSIRCVIGFDEVESYAQLGVRSIDADGRCVPWHLNLISVPHHKAAIDDDGLTRHVIRVSAREKTNHAGHVLGGFGPANRDN